MKARSRFAFITTTIAALSVSALAYAEMKAGSGTVTYHAIATAGLKIDATSKNLAAKEAGGKVIVTIPFVCGGGPCFHGTINKRDEHFVDHVNSKVGEKEAKQAVFTIDKSKIKIPEDGKSESGSATGMLSLNGKHGGQAELAQKITYKITRKGSDYTVEGNTTIDLDRYEIKAAYMGIGVTKPVDVELKFTLHEG